MYLLECHLPSIKKRSLSFCVFPSASVLVHVGIFLCGNIFVSTIRYFDVVSFTAVTTFTFLFSCKLSFQAAGLKITSLPSFSLKSPKNIDLVLGKLIEYLLYFLTESVPCGTSFILNWCMCIQDINITSATLCLVYYIVSLRTLPS